MHWVGKAIVGKARLKHLASLVCPPLHARLSRNVASVGARQPAGSKFGMTRMLAHPIFHKVPPFLQIRRWTWTHWVFWMLAAAGSWYLVFNYLTDRIEQTSSLIRQTLFNLKCDPNIVAVLGEDIKKITSVKGPMNQLKGYADVSFTVQGERDVAKVVVKARRSGVNWDTTFLSVAPNNSKAIVMQDISRTT